MNKFKIDSKKLTKLCDLITRLRLEKSDYVHFDVTMREKDIIYNIYTSEICHNRFIEIDNIIKFMEKMFKEKVFYNTVRVKQLKEDLKYKENQVEEIKDDIVTLKEDLKSVEAINEKRKENEG